MRAKRVMSAKLPRTKTEGNRYQVDALRKVAESSRETSLSAVKPLIPFAPAISSSMSIVPILTVIVISSIPFGKNNRGVGWSTRTVALAFRLLKILDSTEFAEFSTSPIGGSPNIAFS